MKEEREKGSDVITETNELDEENAVVDASPMDWSEGAGGEDLELSNTEFD